MPQYLREHRLVNVVVFKITEFGSLISSENKTNGHEPA